MSNNFFLKPHQFLMRFKDFKTLGENLILDNDKFVIENNKLEGSYESPIFKATPFSELILSWGATTNKHNSVEVMVKVKVEDKWSKYFSYQPWSFGTKNKSVDDFDNLAKLSVDELKVLNDKLGTHFQFKVILRRNKISDVSPRLSLVSITLKIPNYKYEVDAKLLPTIVDYEVPKLNQQRVSEIGNSICSPTSCTMMLMYKGEKLEGEQPHEHIAKLFYDHGNNMFGNWVFNTVGMSSYGYDSYVGRMYSFNELKYHLAKCGPIIVSVGGDLGVYKTNGHLLLVRGYKVLENGKTLVIINDPNINERFEKTYQDGMPLFVYYELPLEVFLKVWKGITYIVE